MGSRNDAMRDRSPTIVGDPGHWIYSLRRPAPPIVGKRPNLGVEQVFDIRRAYSTGLEAGGD
jgi:hypothetical protein